MNLSNELLSQFAKLTVDSSREKKSEKTVYGTTVESDGSLYVKMDGSETLIPIETTTDVKNGDRVTIMIKDHTAVVTGNLSSPSARTDDVKEIGNQVDDQVTKISNLESDNVNIKETLTANTAVIGDIKADNVEIKETLTANNATIETIKADNVEIKESLTAKDAIIKNLESDNVNIKDTLTANKADIEDIRANMITADTFDGKYANIDFSNIGKAAIEYFYATSGLIKDVVIGDATITGELVGVTISGDLIKGNTIVADKLVIKGEDGLYYKLNTDGMTVEAEQTEYNSINGQVIQAKSITATKIDVEDLVAFDATIGGFKITSNAIYSGVKETVDNTTQGIYLDNKGQISFGDGSNFIKYYQDAEGRSKLAVSAESIIIRAVNSEDVNVKDSIEHMQDSVDKAQATVDSNEARITVSESTIEQLVTSISMLVTDENGSSMMTQTSNGWTFNIGSMQQTLNAAADELNSLSEKVNEANNTIENLNDIANDLGQKTAYIVMTTDENGNPCIELGKPDNDFKVRITNTSVDFIEGTSKIAYVNNESLYIERSIIKDELQIGEGQGFVWKRRSNGNMGLRWTGG